MNLSNCTSNFEAPWVVGILEQNSTYPEEWIFMRTGVLISTYLVLVAGYLDLPKLYKEYAVGIGLTSQYSIKSQKFDNFPQTHIKKIKFIRYEDGFSGPDKFGFVILHLESEVVKSWVLSPKLYQRPWTNIERPYFSSKYAMKKKKEYRAQFGGFSTNTQDGAFTIYEGKYFNKRNSLFNASCELASRSDPCISFGNFISLWTPTLKTPHLYILGILRSNASDKPFPEESDINFDADLCPEIGVEFGIVTSTDRISKFFNGSLSCEKMAFDCDGKCHPLGILADGVRDCENGADEEQIYQKHRSEFKKFPKKSPEKKENGKQWIILISIFGSILFIIIVLTLFYVRYMKRKYEKMTRAEIYEFFDGKPQEIEEGEYSEDPFLHLPYDKADEISPKDLKTNETKRLGSGEYGEVFEGELKSRGGIAIQVAVKLIRESADVSHLKAILAEIKIFQYLGQHENIIGFLGAVTGKISRGEVSIALEYANLGNLLNYIRQNYSEYQNSSVDEIAQNDLLKWSWEIAHGMSHLESKRVIHGDLAARNILLTGDKRVKITDFGLSRKLYAYDIYSKQNKAPLPWRHMAIESLRDLTFSSKSDTWAYGVTLWEIFTRGQTPFGGLNWSSEFMDQLENGLRLGKPHHCSDEMFSLIKSCWEKDPTDRPNFLEILKISYWCRSISDGFVLYATL